MIARRELAGALASSLLAAPHAAEAQPASKLYRIGYLASSQWTAGTDPLSDSFLGGMRELGYVEGRNLVIERRSSEGRDERFRALATELASLNVDLIVAPSTPTALAAREATSTIPIVMVVVGEPVGFRLIASLARPGGNVTGLSSSATEITAKQIELLMEIVPHLSRAAVLRDPTSTAHAAGLRELEDAARTLRVSLQPVDARTPEEIESAFAAMTEQRAEALIPLDGPFPYTQRRRIAALALQHRLPTVSVNRSFTESGVLASYGPSFADLFRRAASYVDRILKGAKPADLPVELPTKFELVVNLKTATTLGLALPPSLLQRADEVIE